MKRSQVRQEAPVEGEGPAAAPLPVSMGGPGAPRPATTTSLVQLICEISIFFANPFNHFCIRHALNYTLAAHILDTPIQ